MFLPVIVIIIIIIIIMIIIQPLRRSDVTIGLGQDMAQ